MCREIRVLLCLRPRAIASLFRFGAESVEHTSPRTTSMALRAGQLSFVFIRDRSALAVVNRFLLGYVAPSLFPCHGHGKARLLRIAQVADQGGIADRFGGFRDLALADCSATIHEVHHVLDVLFGVVLARRRMHSAKRS